VCFQVAGQNKGKTYAAVPAAYAFHPNSPTPNLDQGLQPFDHLIFYVKMSNNLFTYIMA
jgi:hypothetical protein